MAKAKTKKRKATTLPTLEEQLAAHDLDAPEPGPSDAYGDSYKRQWMRRRAELVAAIGRRDAKRRDEERTVEVVGEDPEDSKRRRTAIMRCNKADAWRHNQLNGMQREAEKELGFAWRLRTGDGPRLAVSKYGARSSGGSPSRMDLGADIEAMWLEWHRMAPIRGVMADPVVELLTAPTTLTDIERNHRMRRGQGLANHVRGLDLWCELRGWIRGPVLQDGPTLAAEGVTR